MSYGLCCIDNDLQKERISFTTMTFKGFQKRKKEKGEQAALEDLGKVWLNNITVTELIIKSCAKRGWNYRISSNLFPLYTHPEFYYKINDVPYISLVYDVFASIRSFNDNQSVRLSMHPDQFVVLASKNKETVRNSIRELDMHGFIMDAIGCERDYTNPINIHIGTSQGNPSEIAKRFIDAFDMCKASVTSRLVIENDDKGIWNVERLLTYFHSKYNTPITYDNLHDKCNPSELRFPMSDCATTWPCRPLFHYSESDPNKKNPRSHALMPTDFPRCNQYDYDIELKGKCDAIREVERLESYYKELNFCKRGDVIEIYEDSINQS